MARLQEDVDLEEEAEMRRMEQLGAQQGGGGGDAAPPAWVADALGDLAEDVDRDFNPLLVLAAAQFVSAGTHVVMLQQRGPCAPNLPRTRMDFASFTRPPPRAA